MSEPKVFKDILTKLLQTLLFVFVLFTPLLFLNRDTRQCAITVSNHCIKLQIADTKDKRTQGLSGRESMEHTQGMLFVFDNEERQCMWMKDMSFDLDMVWADKNGKIVGIKRKIQPNTYPEEFCNDSTKYVIELNSGVSDEAGLSVGQQLSL